MTAEQRSLNLSNALSRLTVCTVPLNPDLDSLSDYPFEALRTLLNPVTPRVNDEIIAMSVGEPQHQPPALLTETNVTIQLSWAYAAGGPVRVRLQNPTGVPQYQLQVYAYARRGNRYVAAANTTVTDLGAGSKQSLTLPLVGEPDGAPLALEAVPTILQ